MERKEIVDFLHKNNIRVVGSFVSKEDIRAFLTKAGYEIGDNLDDVSKSDALAAQSGLDAFMGTYEKNLSEALEKYPDQYRWPKSELPKVLERMKAAIEKGSFNKDGYAFKQTCKELKIPYTYSGIKDFISK